MTDERMQEITAYATHRLIAGDILAAYALEAIDFAHEAVEARKQAGHSAAELMKLLSQAEKERDDKQVELDAAIRNIARLLAAVEAWEKKAEQHGWTP